MLIHELIVGSRLDHGDQSATYSVKFQNSSQTKLSLFPINEHHRVDKLREMSNRVMSCLRHCGGD